MEEFPEVIGITKILQDHALRRITAKMSLAELGERVRTCSMKGLPPRSRDFGLVENERATIPLPRSFADACALPRIE